MSSALLAGHGASSRYSANSDVQSMFYVSKICFDGTMNVKVQGAREALRYSSHTPCIEFQRRLVPFFLRFVNVFFVNFPQNRRKQALRMLGSVYECTDPARLPRARLVAEPRIERVPKPIAYEIIGEDGEKDHKSRKHGEPPGVDVVTSVVQHAAPCHHRRRHTEAKKGKARFDQDRAGNTERGSDQYRRERIRQHMTH